MDRKYRVVLDGLTDTSRAPKGPDVHYKCKLCGDLVPSQPKDNIGCTCGNVFVDIDYLRLAVKHYSQVQVVRLPRKPRAPRRPSR